MIPLISKHHIESYILGSIINANISHPLDEMEFNDMQIDHEIFNESFAHKLVAKAIYNMKQENLPIDDVLLENYISSKTNKLNIDEYLSITCNMGSFSSVQHYLEILKKLDKEKKLWSRI